MKRIFLVATVALLLSAGVPVMAADMGGNAPVYKTPPPVIVYSWTGFYVGENIGYGWGKSSNNWNFLAPFSRGGALASTCFPNGVAYCATGTDSSKLNGAIGGLQAGSNLQMGNFLVGIEADIQISNQKGSNIFASSVFLGPIFPPGIVAA